MNQEILMTKAINEFLLDWPNPCEVTLEVLMPAIHCEIHRIASYIFSREPCGHTWQVTDLENEFYLLLIDNNHIKWENRGHFFAFAAKKMRHILVNKACERRAEKRGGGQCPVEITNLDRLDGNFQIPVDLLDLEKLLARLSVEDQAAAKVVELRFFSGLTVAEIAELEGLTERTVFRQWSWARAWLHKQLSVANKCCSTEMAGKEKTKRT